MSDDLISREEALERLQLLRKFNTTKAIQITIEAAEMQINFCKTAFDKEKVIEELNDCKKIMLSSTNKDCFGEQRRENDCLACVFNKSIGIVEKGGVE